MEGEKDKGRDSFVLLVGCTMSKQHAGVLRGSGQTGTKAGTELMVVKMMVVVVVVALVVVVVVVVVEMCACECVSWVHTCTWVIIRN